MQNRAQLIDSPLGYIPISDNPHLMNLLEAFVSTSSYAADLDELLLYESTLLALSRCADPHFNELHRVKFLLYLVKSYYLISLLAAPLLIKNE